jgi:transcriptional regulator with XRE-family HTH domain
MVGVFWRTTTMNDRTPSMSFGQRLHRLRIARSLSLQDVATATGISKAHVWNLEKGISDNPSVELAIKLADLFRVRVADLIGENPSSAEEEPEMVAMFRDLKQLEPRDRDTIRVLMEQLRKGQGKPA